MTFLDSIFARLEREPNLPLLREIREGQFVSVTGSELLAMIAQAREFLASIGLQAGNRCAVIAPNSISWVALDLAMMAEGIVVVPLYARQAARELVDVLQDSTPTAVFCSDQNLAAEIERHWPAGAKITPLDRIFSGGKAHRRPRRDCADADAVTIIYTSGTSGEPKGVVLDAGNVNHILGCTNERLNHLRLKPDRPDGVFHYTPFCYAASWIAMLTFLSRNSVLTLSTDLTKLSDELKLAEPDYFLNVPTLLERVRAKIVESIAKRGGLTASIFDRAQRGFLDERKKQENSLGDRLALIVARTALFPKIRKTVGLNLKALICGSAPLALDTQLFFMMIGIPVLQVYGLTETTAICTMDIPGNFVPGFVGKTIPGVEMQIAESGEILVRGANIFPKYWHRPTETEKALEGGWFHTGDQGEVDANGNWRVTGRLKNILVLNSGHKIAPEPLEQALAALLPEAQHLMLLGNQRSYLTLLVMATTGTTERVQAALKAVNGTLPHYKQIRAFYIVPDVLSIENGLLTANGKLKRDAVTSRFAAAIEPLYQKQPV